MHFFPLNIIFLFYTRVSRLSYSRRPQFSFNLVGNSWLYLWSCPYNVWAFWWKCALRCGNLIVGQLSLHQLNNNGKDFNPSEVGLRVVFICKREICYLSKKFLSIFLLVSHYEKWSFWLFYYYSVIIICPNQCLLQVNYHDCFVKKYE